MKILFVCQQYIHSARWINQLKDSHHEIYVFDCLDLPIHKDLLWTNVITGWSNRKLPYLKGEERLSKKFPATYQKIAPLLKITASEKLDQIIEDIQPDLVHSLEMQSETYPLISVYKKKKFTWAYSSWGSDLYLFKNDKNHSKKIKTVLQSIDYFFSDTKRDISIASDMGFESISFVVPGGGGYDFKAIEKYRKPLNERTLLLIKGYHHWAGRALFVLDALETIIDKTKGLDLFVYAAHQSVINRIEKLNKKYDLNISYTSRHNHLPQERIFELFGKAKIAIGNSISDGIPNTLLEAIVLGAFPIQSNPGKASEDYVKHRENGLLIENPEDVSEISNAILEALTNNELITEAHEKNKMVAKELEREHIKNIVLDYYKQIEEEI